MILRLFMVNHYKQLKILKVRSSNHCQSNHNIVNCFFANLTVKIKSFEFSSTKPRIPINFTSLIYFNKNISFSSLFEYFCVSCLCLFLQQFNSFESFAVFSWCWSSFYAATKPQILFYKYRLFSARYFL